MSYTIRALTTKELPLCFPYGEAFMREKQLPGTFSPEAFLRNWTAFLGVQYKATLFGLWNGSELVGGIGGMVAPDLNTGELVANEFFWFVRPEDRGTSWPVRLVKRFKDWGLMHGAVRWRFIHLLLPGEDPSTVKLGPFYRKMGLRPMEVCYDGPLTIEEGEIWRS